MKTVTSEEVIQDAAEKLKNSDVIKNFVLDPSNSDPNSAVPLNVAWNDLSLASGYPGLLLLFSKLQTIGLIEEDIVHHYVLKIKECIEAEGLFDLSLYNGVAGIAFALNQASFQGTRYQGMLNALHTFLSERMQSFYFDQLKIKEPTSSQTYDVIQGLSGVGRYILENLSQANFYQLAQDIAEVFVNLSNPLNIDENTVPGWFLSPSDTLNRRNKKDLKGNFNLGLAHGIPGVLSFFAIALMRGIEVKGQKEAMQRIISWINSKAIQVGESIQWPYSISWEEETQKSSSFQPCRDAWCYGVPGIARTLFLAGKALADTELKSFAVKAFRGIFSRTRQEWNIPGPMLCHGIAGLLAVTCEMARESGCEDLFARAAELKQLLLSDYQFDAPFGFKDIEIGVHGETIKVSKAGFLEGSSGALLALLSDLKPESKWLLPLMIHD